MKKVDHEKDRIEQMDIARGMGILLVVLGHNHVCASGTAIFLSIYSFHIPLFFFLSGLFHKRQVSLTKDICKQPKSYFFHTLLQAWPSRFTRCWKVQKLLKCFSSELHGVLEEAARQ